MTDKPVKIAAKLPRLDAQNGLSTVHGRLLDEGGEAVIIGIVRHSRLTTHPGAIQEPTTEWVRVEGLPAGELMREGVRLIDRARARRANLTTEAAAPSPVIPGLDLDLEAADVGEVTTPPDGEPSEAYTEYVRGFGVEPESGGPAYGSLAD